MQSITVGLDFGTSNSAISMLKGDDAVVLPIGWHGGKTIRSVLYFPEGRTKMVFVGEQGIHEYVDHEMHGRFLQSVKTLLPDPSFEGTMIRSWGLQTAESLVAHIIRYLRDSAIKKVGAEINRVVIGRPVRFSEKSEEDVLAEKRLVTAAQLAGFTEISTQFEPVGAAYHYEHSLDREELVLVADLGGGTTDFTVMRLSPERRRKQDRRDDMLGSSGVYIGGDKFDSLIMRRRLLKYFAEGSTYRSAEKILEIPSYLLLDLCRWQRIPMLREPRIQELIKYLLVYSSDPVGILRVQQLIDDNLGFELFRAIERAKITLTDHAEAKVLFDHSDINIDEPINRSEFEAIIEPEIEVLDRCVSGLLANLSLSPSGIDSVFMTGGSSMVPIVRQLLGRKFGVDKVRSGDNFTSVASGLALSALH